MTRLAVRLLLRLYPRQFRREYEVELIEAIESQLAEIRYARPFGYLRLGWDVTSDVVASAVRMRVARGRGGAAVPISNIHPFPRSRRSPVDIMWTDFKHSVRQLLRRPGFTCTTVLTLALGIGGTSLIFGLMNGLILNPFPYPDPDRFVAIGAAFPKMGNGVRFIEVLSPAEYLDIRGARSLRHVMAFDLGNRNISGGDIPERVFTALVFDDPFATMSMAPALGRGFTKQELTFGGPRAAVLSHRIWQSRFSGNPSLVGQTIRVNGVPTTVVGIMPPRALLIGTDLWLPLAQDPKEWPRGQRQFNVIARLADGISRQEANTELATIAARLERTYGSQHREYAGWRLTAAPWADALNGSVKPAATLLMWSVLCVLVIVCANVAGLSVARVLDRQRDLAVRLALGAGRLRLSRELFMESLVLAAAGGALGLASAAAGLRLVPALLPPQLAALEPAVSFSGPVLAVGIAVTIVATALVALLPAAVASRLSSNDVLKANTHHVSSNARAHRMRQGLVVIELAVALVLLAGAGLMARSLWQLRQIDLGVDARNVLTMRLTLPAERYQGAAITQFFQQLVERMEATPGVVGAATASQYPPEVFFGTPLVLDRPSVPGAALPNANLTIVSPNVFRVLGIPLRHGRGLRPEDRLGSRQVTVVNESFARRYLQGGSIQGRRVGLSASDSGVKWMDVVGIVGDTRAHGAATLPEPELFVTMEQASEMWNQLFLLIRTAGSPSALVPTVRRLVAELDRDQPVYAIQTLEDAFDQSVLQQRASTILLLAFAALAVVLSAMGIYAITSYAVTLRTHEIGIRMALGAQERDVIRLVVRQVGWLLLIGATFGLVGSLALGRLTSKLLVETRPNDPPTLLVVVLLLVVAGLLAGYIPARRASRVNPVEALRTE